MLTLHQMLGWAVYRCYVTESLDGIRTVMATFYRWGKQISERLYTGHYHSVWSGRASVILLSLSGLWLFLISWAAARQASLSFTISWSLCKLMSSELVMSSSHLILCHFLLLLLSIFSIIRVFSSESVLCIRWPKYWSFSFSISPSNEYSGLISFRVDWFDLLAAQGTLKSLLQHHSSKASIPWHSAFFFGPTLT